MTGPEKHSLTAFTTKAKGEIERNTFAAVTGGLVMVSAPSFWEMYYAAIAWHEHAAELARQRSNDMELARREAEGAEALALVRAEMAAAGAPPEAMAALQNIPHVQV